MNADKRLFPDSTTTALGHQTKYSHNGKWYKFDCYGYEAAAEYVSSHLAQYTNIPAYINYSIVNLPINGVEYTACCSSDFLGNDILVSATDLFHKFRNENINAVIKEMNLRDKIEYFVASIEEITGIANYGSLLTQMLEYDAFIINEGRTFDNIHFLYNEKSGFSPAPLFDFGDSFLSNTRDKYPATLSFDDISHSIEAKPFVPDFIKQINACHSLYGKQLSINDSICLTSKVVDNLHSYYGDYVCERINFLLDKQISLHRDNFISPRPSIFNKSFDSQIRSAHIRATNQKHPKSNNIPKGFEH